MARRTRWILTAALVLAPAVPVHAEDEQAEGASFGQRVKEGFKEAGRGIGRGATEVGHAVRDAAKEGWRGTRDEREQVKEAGREVGEGAARVGRAVGDGAKEAGRKVKEAVKGESGGGGEKEE